MGKTFILALSGSLRTGSTNTAIGFGALATNNDGSDNTAVGHGAGVTTASLNNASAFGNGALVNASNKVRIGNSSVTVIEGQVPFTSPSDGRFKFNIRNDVKGLAFILKLRPVTYQFDVKRFDQFLKTGNIVAAANPISKVSNKNQSAASLIRRTGFIAQEVDTAAAAAGYNFSGIIKPNNASEHYSLSYESFVVPLVKAIQEQQDMINAMKRQIALLQANMDRLENGKTKHKKQ